MNFLDGLDEDFEVAPRQPRPVTSPLALVLRALVDADQPLPPPPPPAAAAPGLGAPWQALEGAVHAALHAVRAGDFTAVLRGEAARALLGPVQPSEWEVLPPSALASAAGLAQSGGLPSPGDFGYVCCTLLARRAARFALHGEGDEYYVDAPGSADTPRHWRAALAALVAAACLGLYTQANFTGPEVEREELGGIYPLPWAASLLPAGAEAAAGGGCVGGGGGGGASGGGASGEGGSGALGLAPATLYSRRQWGEGWLLAEEREGEEEAGSGAPGAPAAAAAPAALPQQPPFFTAALELLAPPCLGDSAYPLTSLAHYLGTARALLGGLLRPVPRGAVAVAWEAVCEAREGAREDPRVAQLHELTDALPPLAWLAARAAVLNYRCLTGGGRGAGGGALLLAECAGLFARAAGGVCSEYGARVFGEGDVFQRGLVGGELESSGAQALRGSGSGSGSAGAGAAAQRAFGDPLAEEEAAEEAAECAAVLRARAARHAQPGAALARAHAARLLLEWGLAQHAFKRTAGAKTSFFLAKAESSLRTLLTGAPGKRLKHQSFFTTQLMLRAASAGHQAALAVSQGAEALRLGAAEGRFSGPQAEGEGAEPPPPPPPATVLGGLREVTMAESDPRTEMLEAMRMAEGCSASELAEAAATKHELFYAKGWAASVGLSAPQPAPAPAAPPAPAPTPPAPALADAPLSTLDQCIVLALCLDVSNHNPEDGLTAEEMRPYVARVLDTPLNWSVHSAGLYARALLEFENHRTSDRAALQLAALADAAERSAARLSLFAPRTPGARGEGADADATALPRHRLAHAPALHLPSVWELKREVGERYLKLGAVRDALAVFSGLELWEEVLTCLRLLERPRKALATVRMLVASVAGDDARRLQLAAYLCASAALKDSDEEYARAWEVSGGRYAPAALALGRRCGARGEWARAETFLRAGLRVAPGDGGGWFLLGVAGMRSAGAGALEGAAGAFGRCVQLDATRAEAWANLGSIALQQQQWGRGYAALEQALKADKGDWRILSNFVTAAVRTGALSRAVSAMGALVALAVRGGKTGETGDEEGAVGEGGLHLPALTQVAKRVLDSCWARRRREGEEAAAAAAAAAAPEAAAAAAAAEAEGGAAALSIFDAALQPGGSVLPPLPMSTALEEEEAEGGAAGAAARAAAAAAAAAAAEAAAVDLHAHACLEPLARLLEKITGSLRPPATVWAIFADVEEARGRLGASQACRERQWRSLLAAPGWERSAPLLRGVVDCTQRLVVAGRALVEQGLAARARTAEQARYYAATVRARVEADAEGLAEFEGFAGLASALAAATAEE